VLVLELRVDRKAPEFELMTGWLAPAPFSLCQNYRPSPDHSVPLAEPGSQELADSPAQLRADLQVGLLVDL
jgi:hypothetical protein